MVAGVIRGEYSDGVETEGRLLVDILRLPLATQPYLYHPARPPANPSLSQTPSGSRLLVDRLESDTGHVKLSSMSKIPILKSASREVRQKRLSQRGFSQ